VDLDAQDCSVPLGLSDLFWALDRDPTAVIKQRRRSPGRYRVPVIAGDLRTGGGRFRRWAASRRWWSAARRSASHGEDGGMINGVDHDLLRGREAAGGARAGVVFGSRPGGWFSDFAGFERSRWRILRDPARNFAVLAVARAEKRKGEGRGIIRLFIGAVILQNKLGFGARGRSDGGKGVVLGQASLPEEGPDRWDPPIGGRRRGKGVPFRDGALLGHGPIWVRGRTVSLRPFSFSLFLFSFSIFWFQICFNSFAKLVQT
jgi:hypothetical protein